MRNFIFLIIHTCTTRHQNVKVLHKLTHIIPLIGFLAHQTQSQQFLTPADLRLALEEETFGFLTETDFNNARKYKELLAVNKPRKNILTRQRFFRGDIRGKASWRRKRLRDRLSVSTSRRYNGVASVAKKWPNGRIPYVLNTDYNERERAVLARAFQEYHGRTCIRFVPKMPFDRDYLFIGKIDGCYSDVGRAGGRQELSLDNGCLHFDTIIHELMHSIGFYHEHERWDRDDYLTILWPNIDKDAIDQFGRVDLLESSYYDQPYDYHSIMHYDSLAFSKNGRETLVTKEPTMTAVIGSAIDFSPIDLAKIRRMYRCSDFETFPVSSNLEFIGDNSIAGPTIPSAQQFLVNRGISSPFPIQFPAPAGTVNSVSSKHPNAMPFYMLNRSTARERPVNKELTIDSSESRTTCSDRTNLCGYWMPYCRSVSYQRIMRQVCARSCNFCDRTPKEYPSVHSFPVFVNAQF